MIEFFCCGESFGFDEYIKHQNDKHPEIVKAINRRLAMCGTEAKEGQK